MKPILHVIVDPKSFRGKTQVMMTFKDAVKKLFSNKYDLILTPPGAEFVADNSIVVNLNLEMNNDNIESIINELNKIARESTDPEIEIDEAFECPRAFGGCQLFSTKSTSIKVGEVKSYVEAGTTGINGVTPDEVRAFITFSMKAAKTSHNDCRGVDITGLPDLWRGFFIDGFRMEITGDRELKSIISSLEFIVNTLKEQINDK